MSPFISAGIAAADDVPAGQERTFSAAGVMVEANAGPPLPRGDSNFRHHVSTEYGAVA